MTPAELDDPFDRLEQIARRLAARQRYSDKNRIALLAVHGVMGLVVAFLIAADKPAPSLLLLIGGPLLHLVNLLPAIGGGLLVGGLLLHRNLYLEAAGMTILLAWDGFMGVAFGVVAHRYGSDHNPLTIAASYPIGVYLGLGGLMVVHLVTLAQMLRDGRRVTRS